MQKVTLFFCVIHIDLNGPTLEYWARLNHAIDLAYQVNENIVISGDLNSDLMSLNNNKLIDTMMLFNLKNVLEYNLHFRPIRFREVTH